MRRATFTGLLLTSILLLSASACFAQVVFRGYPCPPTAKNSKKELRGLLADKERYVAALRAKDWDAAQKMVEDAGSGLNLSLSLMRDLLEPLEIKSMDFEVDASALKPCRAAVRYKLSLRAIDSRTRQPAIDLTGLTRVSHWVRFECQCPPNNLSSWVLVKDVPAERATGKTIEALAAAKSLSEQSLLLLNEDEDRLKELASALARKGYDSFKQGREAEALAAFSLNRVVVGRMKHQKNVQVPRLVEYWKKSLAEAEAKNDESRKHSSLSTLASLYTKLGEHERALKLYHESLKLVYERSLDAAAVYAHIATIHRDRGEYERAVEYFVKSGEIYKAVADLNADKERKLIFHSLYQRSFFNAFFNQMFLYEALGREDLAQKAYDVLYVELVSVFDKGSEEDALLILLRGVVKAVKGRVAEAVADAEAAAGMLARVRSQYGFVASCVLIELYLLRNDYTQAAKYLAMVREAMKGPNKDEVGELSLLIVEGLFYTVQGDERLAASRNEKVLSRTLAPDLTESGTVDFAAGTQREGLSRLTFLPGSVTSAVLGVTLAKMVGDVPTDASFELASLLNKAVALQYLRGDLPAYRLWLSRLLRLAEDDGDMLLASEAHFGSALLYHAEKDYRQALDHYRQSLQLLEGAPLPLTLHLMERERSTRAGIWLNIARAHADSGEVEQALAAYEKIFERGRFFRLFDTFYLHETAEFNFKAGKYEEALKIIVRAMEAAERGGVRDSIWKFHTLAGKAYRALKRDGDAARSFAEAVREVEASRAGVAGGGRIAARFFEDKLGPYQGMISLLAEQGRCAEALAYAERSKSRVLLDVLGRGGSASRLLTDAERKLERALRAEMFTADREYASARARLRDDERAGQLRVKRLEARLEYEAFRIGLTLPGAWGAAEPSVAPDLTEMAELAALLPPAGGALLEFTVTDDKTYLFVLTEGDVSAGASTPDGRCEIHVIPLGAEELKSRVAEFNLRIANREGVVGSRARELYRLLLEPARATLAGKTDLVIVPDRGLWTLPFQALQADNGRYLLQESAISYAPSLTSLREMRKQRPARAGRSGAAPSTRDGPKLFALANPAGSAPPLPGTEALVRRLARLYGAGRSKVYTGAQASEKRVKMEARGFDIIHVSAHGILDDDDAMHSRVELARAPAGKAEEDGMLEAWEIMDLELDAQLVVLSACETARGRASDGEGVVGLTWAIFMAGVPASVVSQWPVDEGATSELMYLFHENLLRGGSAGPARLDKAESLRQASLNLLSSVRYEHPYYWAGFILVGDGQ